MIDNVEKKRVIADSLVENLTPFSTEDLIFHIFNGLDSSYRPFIAAFMIKDDNASIDDLIGLFLQEEARLEQKSLRQTIAIPPFSPISPLALNLNCNPSMYNSNNFGSSFTQTSSNYLFDSRHRQP
uniref:Uncharacterized protein n=1 Tax=Lactuca sativa TaxID=4236 RepID=A0A9R1W2F8_LACSA|nr:hypothetical protein LSAT_V11C300109680 [Lactuca sativa]